MSIYVWTYEIKSIPTILKAYLMHVTCCVNTYFHALISASQYFIYKLGQTFIYKASKGIKPNEGPSALAYYRPFAAGHWCINIFLSHSEHWAWGNAEIFMYYTTIATTHRELRIQCYLIHTGSLGIYVTNSQKLRPRTNHPFLYFTRARWVTC